MRRVTRFFTRTLTVLSIDSITADRTHRSPRTDVQGIIPIRRRDSFLPESRPYGERPVVETKDDPQRQKRHTTENCVTETTSNRRCDLSPRATEFAGFPKSKVAGNPLRQPTLLINTSPKHDANRPTGSSRTPKHTFNGKPGDATSKRPQRLLGWPAKQVDYERSGGFPYSDEQGSCRRIEHAEQQTCHRDCGRLPRLPDNTASQWGQLPTRRRRAYLPQQSDVRIFLTFGPREKPALEGPRN